MRVLKSDTVAYVLNKKMGRGGNKDISDDRLIATGYH
jgi:hypothetical protein